MADLDEVLSGLKLCEGHGSFCAVTECPYFGTRLCVQSLHDDAGGLLESLQTQITELKAKNSELFSRWLHEGR